MKKCNLAVRTTKRIKKILKDYGGGNMTRGLEALIERNMNKIEKQIEKNRKMGLR